MTGMAVGAAVGGITVKGMEIMVMAAMANITEHGLVQIILT
jgi:hypothetical protein